MSFARWLRNLQAVSRRRREDRKGRVRFRPRLEALEDRTVPTIVFEPHFGAEQPLPNQSSIDLGGLVLQNSPVFLLFWGTYWSNTNGPGPAQESAIIQNVKSFLSQGYTSGLNQYRGAGGDHFVNAINWNADPPTSFSYFNLAGPNFLSFAGGEGVIEKAIASQTTGLYFPRPSTAEANNGGVPIYLAVTPPGVSSSDLGGCGYHTLAVQLFSATDTEPEVVGWAGADPSGCTILNTPTSTPADVFQNVIDTATHTLSHEIVEATSDPAGVYLPLPDPLPSFISFTSGIMLDPPASWPKGTQSGSHEVGDYEADQNYAYRLNGAQVQAYWSANTVFTAPDGSSQTGAFIVPDGNTENFYLIPNYGTVAPGTSQFGFQGTYQLVVNGDQMSNAIAVDSFTDPYGGMGLKVTLNGQTAQFDAGTISSLTINDGSGNDTIVVNSPPSDVNLTVNTESADVDLTTDSSLTVNCGTGNVTITNTAPITVDTGNASAVNLTPGDGPVAIVGSTANVHHVSARILNGVLTVQEGGDNEEITIRTSPNDSSLVDVWLGGTGGTVDNLLGTFSKSDFGRIQVNGGSGNDTLTTDYSYGLPASTVTFDGGGGTNTLDVVDRSGNTYNQETDTLSAPRGGQIRFYDSFGFGPVIDYSNVDTIDDTESVTTYQAVDSMSGSGQDLGVSDGFSPLGPYVTVITGSDTTTDEFGGASFVRYTSLYVDNKSNITVTGPTTDPITFDVTYVTAVVPLTVQGQNGLDTFNINWAPNNNTITVSDTGTAQASTLNINDTTNADAQGGTYDISSGKVERKGNGVLTSGDSGAPYSEDVTIAYSNLGWLYINGGDSGYVYTVNSTAAGTTTTINAGTGSDAVNVVENVLQWAGAATDLAGPLTVNGDGATTTLLLDDRYVLPVSIGSNLYLPGPSTYTIDDGSVQRNSETQVLNNGVLSFPRSSASIGYSGLASVTIQDDPAVSNLGDGSSNTLQVFGTGGTNQAVLGVNSTAAQVKIGSPASQLQFPGPGYLPDNGLNTIGSVAVNGNSDTTLTLDDTANGIHSFTYQANDTNVDTETVTDGTPTYYLTAGQIQRSGTVSTLITDFYTGAVVSNSPPVSNASTITYKNIRSLTLDGGSVANTFNVQSNSIPVTLAAGNGGDTIKAGDATHSLDEVNSTLDVIGGTNTHVILDDEATQNYIVPPFGSDSSPIYEYYQNSPVYTVTDHGVERQNTATDTFEKSVNGVPTIFIPSPPPPPPPSSVSSISFTNIGSLELDGANLQDIDNSLPQPFMNNSSSNSFTIQSGTDITVKAGNGGDRIQLGDANNSLDNIGAMSVIGNTGCQLTLDDEANQTVTSPPYESFGEPIHYTQPTFTVNGTTVSRVNLITDIYVNPDTGVRTTVPSTAHLNVQYQNPGALAIIGGDVTTTASGAATGNTFNVENVQAGENVTIRAGAGNDQVNVGSSPVNLSQSVIDGIQGPVTVYGGGNTSMAVYDQGTGTTQNWDVANTWIDRFPSGGSEPAVPQITYHSLAAVTVNTGTGQNFIGVRSTAAGTKTLVNGNGGGYDETIIENVVNMLDDIQGPVHVHDVAPSNLFIVDEGNTVGYTYTLTTGQVQRVQRSGGVAIQPITYDNMGQIVVATANNPYFGHTPNTVDVYSLGANTITEVPVGTGDHVTVGQNGTMTNIVGSLRIQSALGQVPAQVTLDDSGNTTAYSPLPRTVTLGSDPFYGYLVSGLAEGGGNIGLLLDPATPVALKTGASNQVFHVKDKAGVPSLSLDGGGTNNTLDYSAYKGDVMVDLPKAYATGFAGVTNIQNVIGSNGNNLMVGDGSGNYFTGGTGRNVLIGGGGGATLDARNSLGDNILIGGTTDWDMTLPALQAIMKEWDRTDLGFTDRRGDLLGDGNSLKLAPLNVLADGTQVLLTPATNPTSTNGTVHGDTTAETLLGSLNAPNWFFVDANGDDTDNYSSKNGDKKDRVR